MELDNSYVTINLDAIEANFNAISKKAGNAVMAVIKADGYGHGAVEIARLLQGKCAFFGLASISEALQLRRAGITAPLLVLGHTPVSAFPEAIQEGIRVTIFHYETAVALSEEAVRQDKTAYFHFAVDTGMSRLGFQVTEEHADTCAALRGCPVCKWRACSATLPRQTAAI